MSSIRRQLTLGMMAAVVLLYGLAALFCYAGTGRILRRHFDTAMHERARALCALVVQEPDGRLEVMPAESTMSEFGNVPGAHYLQIWDADGNVVQRSGSLRGSDIVPPPSTDAILMWDTTLPNGLPGRGVRVWFTPGVEDEHDAPLPGPAGELRPHHERFALALLRDRSPVQDVEIVLMSALLVTFASLCASTLLVVPLVVRRGLAPLRRLSEHAGRIDATSLSGRFPVAGLPAELRPITDRLNDLLERLEAGFRRERRFSADVAHELRTPIAELRMLAEVALRWPGDEDASRGAFEDALAVARRMEDVVTTLLALARFDSCRLTVGAEPVDLSAAVREAWRPTAASAAARELAVTFALCDDAVVIADRNMAVAIATNLLSNAVTYSPPGGLVDCAVRNIGSFIELSISNTNGSLTPDDLRHMAQPFWRKDTSRSDPSHSGLGLALVSAYAIVQGAEFEVLLTPENLFRATVRFPIAGIERGAPALPGATMSAARPRQSDRS